MTLPMFSRWLVVMYCFKFMVSRAINSSVSTIANPLKIAPATKYGGKIVVCHPGSTDVAKSIDTMLCTLNTSGVARPAKIMYEVS